MIRAFTTVDDLITLATMDKVVTALSFDDLNIVCEAHILEVEMIFLVVSDDATLIDVNHIDAVSAIEVGDRETIRAGVDELVIVAFTVKDRVALEVISARYEVSVIACAALKAISAKAANEDVIRWTRSPISRNPCGP